MPVVPRKKTSLHYISEIVEVPLQLVLSVRSLPVWNLEQNRKYQVKLNSPRMFCDTCSNLCLQKIQPTPLPFSPRTKKYTNPLGSNPPILRNLISTLTRHPKSSAGPSACKPSPGQKWNHDFRQCPGFHISEDASDSIQGPSLHSKG